MTKVVRAFESEIADAARQLPPGTRLADEASLLVASFASDPEWSTWVNERIVSYVHDILRSTLRSERSRAYRGQGIERLAAAVDAGAIYEVEWHTVDNDGTWKPLGAMTRGDLVFAANDYSKRALTMGMRAAFLRSLAERVPQGRTVREVITPEQLQALRAAIGQNDAA